MNYSKSISEDATIALARATEKLISSIDEKYDPQLLELYYQLAPLLPKEKYIKITCRLAYRVDDSEIAKKLIADAMREILILPLEFQAKYWILVAEPICKHFPDKLGKLMGLVARILYLDGVSGLISLASAITSFSPDTLSKIAPYIIRLTNFYPNVFTASVLFSVGARLKDVKIIQLALGKIREIAHHHTKKATLLSFESLIPEEYLPLWNELLASIKFINDDEKKYFEKITRKNSKECAFVDEKEKDELYDLLLCNLEKKPEDLRNAILAHVKNNPSLALEIARISAKNLLKLSESEMRNIVVKLHEAYNHLLPPLRERYLPLLFDLYQYISDKEVGEFLEEVIESLNEYNTPRILNMILGCVLLLHGDRIIYLRKLIPHLEKFPRNQIARIFSSVISEMRIQELCFLAKYWEDVLSDKLSSLVFDLHPDYWHPEVRIRHLLEGIEKFKPHSKNIIAEALAHVLRYEIVWGISRMDTVKMLQSILPHVDADVAFNCLRAIISAIPRKEYIRYFKENENNLAFAGMIATVGAEVYGASYFSNIFEKFPSLHISKVLFDIEEPDIDSIMNNIDRMSSDDFMNVITLLDKCSPFEVYLLITKRYSTPRSPREIAMLEEIIHKLSTKNKNMVVYALARKILEWPPEATVHSIALQVIEKYEPLIAYNIRERIMPLLKKLKLVDPSLTKNY